MSLSVLVTGGAGFIGSQLVAELLKQHHEVKVFDNLSTGYLKNIPLKEVSFIKDDINNLSKLKEVSMNVDVIFHLAAFISVPLSIKHPKLAYRTNVKGTLNVLEAARINDVKKVIFSSSCAVFGNPKEVPIKEDSKLNPITPYAFSKVIAEKYCKLFNNRFGIKTVCLRYFNVYGPRQDITSPYSSVIPKFIFACLKNKPITIFGDGKQTRDFIFVKDVVNANLVFIDRDIDGVFNVGSSVQTSINHLAATIMDIIGKQTEVKHEKERKGDIRHSMACIEKMKRRLKWEPKYSLNEGLKKTVNYFTNLV